MIGIKSKTQNNATCVKVSKQIYSSISGCTTYLTFSPGGKILIIDTVSQNKLNR